MYVRINMMEADIRFSCLPGYEPSCVPAPVLGSVLVSEEGKVFIEKSPIP